MDHLIISYSIKASISLALFYGLYMLLLRTDTFFRLRRFYFLFSIIFSLLFPFLILEIEASEEVPVQMPVYWLSQIEVSAVREQVASSIDITSVGLVIVAVIILICALRFAIQLLSIMKLRVGHESNKKEAYTIVKVNNKKISAFSFFKWIFIDAQNDDKEELDEIIAHEMVHARQYHSIDVLLAEIMCIFFWWNPFAWLLKREIKINLEYLADEGVLNKGFNSKKYQYILLQTSNTNTGIPIINNFNVSQLKKRITMMNKNRTSMGKATKYLLLVPVAFVLLLGNAVQASPDIARIINIPFGDQGLQVPQKKGDVFVTVEEMPAFPGGQNALSAFFAKNLKYPVDALEKNISGVVFVRYIVRSTGEITDVEVIKSVHPSLDKEALRIVKLMPKWTSGNHKGKAVDVYYSLPFAFKLSGHKINASETSESKTVAADGKLYNVVDEMPTFPGGEKAMQKFISDNLKYPKSAQDAGIEGRITVRFVVGKTGQISDIFVVRGIDAACDDEAVRMIKSMPNWTPGSMKGEAVPVYFTLPIVFKLQKEESKTIVKK